MMGKENTFTCGPFSVRCFELKKILEIISTEIKPPKKPTIQQSIVGTGSLFSVLRRAVNVHHFCKFLYCQCFQLETYDATG